MKTLNTIEEISRVFTTPGSSPALVLCEDFNLWVCKYDRTSINLFNEMIASSFAKIWGIKVPDSCFILVDESHVPVEKFPVLEHRFFNKECFGSFYLTEGKEIDRTSLSLFEERTFRNKINNKEDFLKIALFDIWLGNEDRNHNNFNLLLNIEENQTTFFYAIDHVCIFNSSFLDYGINELSEDESIIKTELAKILFSNFRNLPSVVNDLVEKFYLCVDECENQLEAIVNLTPDSWALDRAEILEKLRNNLFTDAWKERCENVFREFIQAFIIKKK